jgi:hypothetical protein
MPEGHEDGCGHYVALSCCLPAKDSSKQHTRSICIQNLASTYLYVCVCAFECVCD